MAKGNSRHIKPKYNSFDRSMIAISLLEPVFSLPQVIRLFTVKNAVSLSLVTWIFYLATTVIWLIWGFKRKLKPIYVPQIFWICVELVMIYGIIIY